MKLSKKKKRQKKKKKKKSKIVVIVVCVITREKKGEELFKGVDTYIYSESISVFFLVWSVIWENSVVKLPYTIKNKKKLPYDCMIIS